MNNCHQNTQFSNCVRTRFAMDYSVKPGNDD